MRRCRSGVTEGLKWTQLDRCSIRYKPGTVNNSADCWRLCQITLTTWFKRQRVIDASSSSVGVQIEQLKKVPHRGIACFDSICCRRCGACVDGADRFAVAMRIPFEFPRGGCGRFVRRFDCESHSL